MEDEEILNELTDLIKEDETISNYLSLSELIDKHWKEIVSAHNNAILKAIQNGALAPKKWEDMDSKT